MWAIDRHARACDANHVTTFRVSYVSNRSLVFINSSLNEDKSLVSLFLYQPLVAASDSVLHGFNTFVSVSVVEGGEETLCEIVQCFSLPNYEL